jgi:hypothetical protein
MPAKEVFQRMTGLAGIFRSYWDPAELHVAGEVAHGEDVGPAALDWSRWIGVIHGPNGSWPMPVQDVQQATMIAPPEAAIAALQVLQFAAGQCRAGGPQGRQTGAWSELSHQVDGRVARFNAAAMSGPTTRLNGEIITSPTMLPVGEGAGGDAEAVGDIVLQESPTAGPTLKGYDAVAQPVLSLPTIALRGPAASTGRWLERCHRLSGLRYGKHRRYRHLGRVGR